MHVVIYYKHKIGLIESNWVNSLIKWFFFFIYYIELKMYWGFISYKSLLTLNMCSYIGIGVTKSNLFSIVIF